MKISKSTLFSIKIICGVSGETICPMALRPALAAKFTTCPTHPNMCWVAL